MPAWRAICLARFSSNRQPGPALPIGGIRAATLYEALPPSEPPGRDLKARFQFSCMPLDLHRNQEQKPHPPGMVLQGRMQKLEGHEPVEGQSRQAQYTRFSPRLTQRGWPRSKPRSSSNFAFEFLMNISHYRWLDVGESILRTPPDGLRCARRTGSLLSRRRARFRFSA